MTTTSSEYSTKPLTPESWADFASLVEANNVVPDGFQGSATGNRDAKRAHVEAGGGVVEAHPEQLEGCGPQQGEYLHTGPESHFEEVGFVRDRRIAKWRWVMRLNVAPSAGG